MKKFWKTKKRRLIAKLVILYTLLSVVILLLNYVSLNIYDTKLIRFRGANINDIKLPFSGSSCSNSEVFEISGKINYNLFSQTLVNIIPDDCLQDIRINNVSVKIYTYGKLRLCDTKKGITIDLKKYLHPGTNEIIFQIWDKGGRYGLKVSPVIHNLNTYFFALLALEFLIIIKIFYILIERYFNSRLAFIFFLLISAKLAYIFLFTNIARSPLEYIDSDMSFYENQADALLFGKSTALPTIWPPFYYIFVALIYGFLYITGQFGIRYMFVPFIHALMFSFSVVFIYKITEKLSSKKPAMIATILYCLYYPYTYFNVLFLSENLFIPLVLAGFYVLIEHYEKIKLKHIILLGLLWGMALLTRPIFASFMPLFVLWFLINKKFSKAALKQISLFVVVVFILLIIQSMFNYAVTGGQVKLPVTANGVHFALNWCYLKDLKYVGSDYSWTFAPPAYSTSNRTLTTTTPLTNSNYYYGIGLQCIKENPKLLIAKLENILMLFKGIFFPLIYSIKFSNILIMLSRDMINLVLLPLSIVSFFLLSKRNKKYSILFLLILFSLFIMQYLQSAPDERYLMSYNFIFITLGSIGFFKIIKLILRKES